MEKEFVMLLVLHIKYTFLTVLFYNIAIYENSKVDSIYIDELLTKLVYACQLHPS